MATTFITMTSKGTFTMPAQARKRFGITKAGDKLIFDMSETSARATITKPVNMREIQKRNAAIVKAKGIKPATIEELRKLRDQPWDPRLERYTNNG